MAEIFVSHAVADRALAELLVDFLKEAIGVPSGSVFCSSAPGRGIPFTQDFNAYMASEIQRPNLLVVLLTETYLESHFCLMELGAAWALGHSTLPIVVPPVTFDVISKTLGLIQGWDITNEAGLRDLRQVLQKSGIELEPRDEATWDRKRIKWTAYLHDALLEVRRSSLVPRTELLSVSAELAKAHSEVEALRKRLTQLEARERGRTVLIVDPEPLIALDIEQTLTNSGFYVVGIARNSTEAWAQAVEMKPDLIITETLLSDGGSGIEVAESIADAVQCSIIFVTAYPEKLSEAERNHASTLVTKPYNPKMLLETVEKVSSDRLEG